MALCDSHSGSHWLSQPLSGILWPSLAHYCSLISRIQSLIGSQGPCSALIADATMTHFIPLCSIIISLSTSIALPLSHQYHYFITIIIIITITFISISVWTMNVIQKEPQRCLWRWRWLREREEQVKTNSFLVSMHISPDSELKYLLQKEEFSGWKITSVEPFNDGNKGSEWSWHKKRARKRAQYFLWPRLSQLSTVIIKNPK